MVHTLVTALYSVISVTTEHDFFWTRLGQGDNPENDE